jgi:hypothetical protein
MTVLGRLDRAVPNFGFTAFYEVCVAQVQHPLVCRTQVLVLKGWTRWRATLSAFLAIRE